MVWTKVGRYQKPEWVEDKFDPETDKYYCRVCGKLNPKKNMYYCKEEHRYEWYKKNSPFGWSILRNEALIRDKDKCVKCGEPAFVVHHIKPVKFYPELEFEIDNLESLCVDCDSKAHIGMFTKLQRLKHDKDQMKFGVKL